MPTILEQTTLFASEEHKKRFDDLMKVQMVTRPQIFKRETAVIYLVSALHYTKPEELFHPRGCHPMTEVAAERYASGELDERDAIVFLLALNLYNGIDGFKAMKVEGNATPYFFNCKLGKEAYLASEAMKIFHDGYDYKTIQ